MTGSEQTLSHCVFLSPLSGRKEVLILMPRVYMYYMGELVGRRRGSLNSFHKKQLFLGQAGSFPTLGDLQVTGVLWPWAS